MKKICIILSLFCAFASFAQSEMDEEKPSIEQEASADISAIQTANALAKYGYENNSASALIEAAEILAQVQTQKLEATAEVQGTNATGEKEAIKDGYTAEKLLLDGKKLAGKDKALSKWIAEVEKLVKKRGTRGADGGPKSQCSLAYGGGGKTQYKVPFYANEPAEIYIESIDSADLDLYVYDENWNLITKDTSYALDCYVRWYPRWTGRFYVIIQNKSRWNSCFQIFTN